MISDNHYNSTLRLMAYNGDSNAQYDIAEYFETVEIDLDQSFFWYKKSALQGHSLAIKKCEEHGIDLNAPIIDREIIRKDLQCRLYPLGYLEKYKFTAICASYKGKWVLSRHKKRDTWETQGGHIESDESPFECARRELFEESGIKDATLFPICDYWGFNKQACSNGVVFLAVVHSLGDLPESEMKEIKMFDTLPSKLTYPDTTPRFIEEAEQILKNVEVSAMAVVLHEDRILSTVEMIYGKETLSLPKGHQEINESLIETAIRECFEETNVFITQDDLIKGLESFSYEFLTPSKKHVRKIVVPFLFRVKNEGDPIAKEKRMISVNWMDMKDFSVDCTHENVRKVVASIK